jgi:predicted helicase
MTRLYANDIAQSVTDWNQFPPLIDSELNGGATGQAIFQSFFNGIETGREDLKKEPKSGFERNKIVTVAYQPFCKQYFHLDEELISQSDWWLEIYKKAKTNNYIAINAPGKALDFCCLGTNTVCDTHFLTNLRCMPLYRYNTEGNQVSNISNWALQLFSNHYHQNEPSSPVCYAGSQELRDEFKLDIPTTVAPITKEAIFYYVYAVLHHPAYLKKYELNLIREFPRIPLYNDFRQWSAWGKLLMDLHIHYETATPYPLQRKDVAIDSGAGTPLDSLLNATCKANKAEGTIEIDAFTTLSGIPQAAWEYKIGARSALEWVIDQYNKTKQAASTTTGEFDPNRFYNYKEQAIDLLQRVCTVCVQTMKIIKEMP